MSTHQFIKNILIGFIVTASLMSCVDYLDKETDTEIAKFTLEGSHPTSTAIVFAELVRDNENWVFHTIGEGLVGDLNQVAARFQ